MANTEDIQTQIEILRRIYVENLPEKIHEITEKISSIEKAVSDEALSSAIVELRGHAHKLAGSGLTYGFEEFGRKARELELFLDSRLEKGVSKADFPVDACVPFALDLSKEFKAIERGGAGRELAPCEPMPQLDRDRDKIHVLIAEAEREIGEQVDHDLATFGFEVTKATGTDEFESVFQSVDPDVILMDFDFPNQPRNGAQVLADMRARGEVNCPVVFYSDHADIGARLAAVRAGCSAYLLKPTFAAQLIEALDHVISHDDPQPYRILIIDDDLSTARYSEVVLSGHNMIVEVQNDPMHVLETLRDFAPELILMDLYMPECSGSELAEVIRQQDSYASIPIVFLSGEVSLEKQIRAMNAGGDDFLTKPIAADQLVAAVRLRVQRFRRLRSQMISDSLTGLFNHTSTREFLEKEIGRSERDQTTVCFLMMDIDHFKSVNDTHGHPVGDRVIIALSRLLRQRLRTSDIVGRLGGEEFGVILPATSLNSSEYIADEIRQSFSDINFAGARGSFNVTISIGIAAFPDYATVADIIEAADQALYRAKRGGRNRVCRAGPAK